MDKKLSLWHRPIPTLPLKLLALGMVATLGLGYAWLYTGDYVSDVFWYAKHRGTAVYEGHAIRVPFPWREEYTPAGQHVLQLQRHHVSLRYTGESLFIRYIEHADGSVADHVERTKRVFTQLRPDAQVTPLALDQHLASTYSCLNSRSAMFDEIFADCFSMDNRIYVTFIGTEAGLPDMKTVLANLLAADKAPK